MIEALTLALVTPLLLAAGAVLFLALQYRNLSHRHSALCREYVAVTKALRETRERILTWPIDDTETCMCGSPVSGHGIGDGHSPVSMSGHAISGIVEEIDKALGA